MSVVHVNSGDHFDVYVGRGRVSTWGNPFVIGTDGSREDVIEKYRAWLWKRLREGRLELPVLAELDGKTLACWCAPERCHGDVLVEAAAWAKRTLLEQGEA
jgi:hypothetical protein